MHGLFHGKSPSRNGWWMGVPLLQETTISFHHSSLYVFCLFFWEENLQFEWVIAIFPTFSQHPKLQFVAIPCYPPKSPKIRLIHQTWSSLILLECSQTQQALARGSWGTHGASNVLRAVAGSVGIIPEGHTTRTLSLGGWREENHVSQHGHPNQWNRISG